MPSSSRGDRTERAPMSFIAAAGWTLGALLLQEVAVELTEQARPGARGDLVNVMACVALAYSIVTFAVVRFREPEHRLRDVLALRPAGPIGVALAAAVGAGLHPLLLVVDAKLTAQFPPSDDDRELLDRLLVADTAAQRIALAVAVGLALPVVREFFFHGVVFGGLRRAHPVRAVVFATAVYGAAQSGDAGSFATTLLLGLVLGWIRAESGSVVPAVVANVAYVAASLAPMVGGRELVDEAHPWRWVAGGLALSLVAAGAARAIWRGDPRAEANRAADA